MNVRRKWAQKHFTDEICNWKEPECTGLWVRFGSPNAHPHHSVSIALWTLAVIHPSSYLLLSWFTDLISYGDTDTFQLNLFPESFLPTSSLSYCLCLRPRLLPLSSRYFRNILLFKVVNNTAQYLYNPWTSFSWLLEKIRNYFSIRTPWRLGTLNGPWYYFQYTCEKPRLGGFSARLQKELIHFNLTLRFWVLCFPLLGSSGVQEKLWPAAMSALLPCPSCEEPGLGHCSPGSYGLTMSH